MGVVLAKVGLRNASNQTVVPGRDLRSSFFYKNQHKFNLKLPH